MDSVKDTKATSKEDQEFEREPETGAVIITVQLDFKAVYQNLNGQFILLYYIEH